MAWMNILRHLDKCSIMYWLLHKIKMKQICWELFCDFFRHKMYWFKLTDCDHSCYRCNPCVWPEKCYAANLLTFHTKNAPKVNLTSWTNILTLFMNTVKHFVKVSTQKLEIIQRKVVKQINCCLPLHHFVSNFGFVGSVMLHLKSRFWLAESTEPMWLIFASLATHRVFLIPHVWGCRLWTDA